MIASTQAERPALHPTTTARPGAAALSVRSVVALILMKLLLLVVGARAPTPASARRTPARRGDCPLHGPYAGDRCPRC